MNDINEIRKYLQEKGLYVNKNIWKENNEIHIVLLDLEESMYEHEKLDILMNEIGYEEESHIIPEDCVIEHIYVKK